ncbi:MULTISPECIES: hypothetical protein [Streptosporangium]|uniref:Integral membrane protein n=1 Tax=Streptosporangium brasiliense TaxID=47480 RepID=A0ABT9R6F3_9ACTN|nr:hypothetical protein [Streptosporangium brasiliense]MDP9864827.1 hypothetical protein [Streptosporangium brasiliense]
MSAAGGLFRWGVGRRLSAAGGPSRRGAGSGGRRSRAALAVWAALVVAAFAAGAVLRARGALPIDRLPPLHGRLRTPTAALLPPLLLAAAAVAVLPGLAVRLRFGQALAVAYGTALTWTVLLAVSGDGLAQPFTSRYEYLAVLPAVGDDPLGWLASFTERLPGYPTHVRGHPPLPVLVLWALAEAGLPGPFWAAVLAVAVGCSATVAVALTVRRLAGEESARLALPYLALTPAAVWIATTMDAFFAGVGAWGVALLVSGGRGRGRVLSGAAGVLLGALPYLSYGLVPYLLIPVVAAVVARISHATVVACLAGAAAVTAAAVAGGFLWPLGVLATHAEWAADPGAARPYLYFLAANLAVLALLTGPATAAGLARTPPGGVRALVAAAVVAVLALDVSGVTRGEVERIWVPYAVWIVLAAASSPGRWWLAAQALTGLLLQGLVSSPW